MVIIAALVGTLVVMSPVADAGTLVVIIAADPYLPAFGLVMCRSCSAWITPVWHPLNVVLTDVLDSKPSTLPVIDKWSMLVPTDLTESKPWKFVPTEACDPMPS